MASIRRGGRELEALLSQARACRACEAHLPFGPRPVLRASVTAQLLIVGQAPGRRVHESGIPWNDPSGNRLRDWLQLDRKRFYDQRHIAIIPTALCYPGTGLRGDLPPRPECAPLWHPRLLAHLPKVRLVLLIGSHAQAYYLGGQRKATLTDTVRAWREYLPNCLPLPHPSPRNQVWLKRNPWFAGEVIPFLRRTIPNVLEG
ncbi:MAG TPA: uracil-DNA glycosylase family protein [Burkholderiales bacterium]|jgi:uracil-DNA glycosylase|nr:uracil-DNA glycosylase family protein [Burkholderiales bacterium]